MLNCQNRQHGMDMVFYTIGCLEDKDELRAKIDSRALSRTMVAITDAHCTVYRGRLADARVLLIDMSGHMHRW